MRFESFLSRILFGALFLLVSLSRGLPSFGLSALTPDTDKAAGRDGVDLDGDGIPDEILVDTRCNC